MVDGPIYDAPSGPVSGTTGALTFEAGVLTMEITGKSPFIFTLVTRALTAVAEAHPAAVRLDPVLTRDVDTWTCTGTVRETTAEASAKAAVILHRAGCKLRT